MESGGMNFLSNQRIRVGITEMYESELPDLDKRFEIEYDMVMNYLKPIIFKEFTPSTLMRNSFVEGNYPLLNYTENRQGLCADTGGRHYRQYCLAIENCG